MSKTTVKKADPAQATGRYRLTTKDGLVVILFAQNPAHAKMRWAEFHPTVNPDSVNVELAGD